MAYREKQCAICKRSFQPKSGAAKYCEQCRKIAEHEYSLKSYRKWRAANPEKYREKQCAICNQTFQPNSSTSKYCKECQILTRREIKLKADRKYRTAHPERVREQDRKRYAANPDKFLKNQRNSLANANFFKLIALTTFTTKEAS